MKIIRAASNAACLLVFGISATGLSSASEKYSKADAEKYIQATESAWAESVATNDVSLVKRILADGYVGLVDGEVSEKAAAIADAERPSNYTSDHLDYAHVRFFGDTAVVQGSETWTKKDGKTGHFVWIDTWIYRHGQWKVVASNDVTVPIKN